MTLIISHYSFLYAARDIMDLAISLARKTTAPEERLDRISRMKSIFTADPINARALAWHAVQLLAVGRNYRIHTSCDTLRVFMGGVYLWAFAKYFPDDPSVIESENENEKEGVKLDDLPWTKTWTGAENWITSGGKASIQGVDNLCSKIGAGEVLKLVMHLLQRMQLWGIGEKFCVAVQEISMID